MPEQTFTIAAVSTQTPEDYSFEKNGEKIQLKVYRVKVDGSDDPLALLRQPKTAPPKQGDTIIGEIVTNKTFGKQLKVKREQGGVGRTGQSSRQDPRETRANMAVKTAFEQGCEYYDNPADPTLQKWVNTHAKFLFDLASKLVEG